MVWWVYVIVVLEFNSIVVFNKGIEKGFNVEIFCGGYIIFNFIVGVKLLWKKV